METRGFIYKSKGGVKSEGWDQEKLDLLQEGIINWQENNTAGVKTMAAF